MNNELARELKDAGFPQSGDGKWYAHLAATNTWKVYENWGDVYIPTLSELIEACPHTLHGRGVFTLSSSNAGELWIADYLDYSKMKVDDKYRGQGPTPEEAVARLWLALNKHA